MNKGGGIKKRFIAIVLLNITVIFFFALATVFVFWLVNNQLGLQERKQNEIREVGEAISELIEDVLLIEQTILAEDVNTREFENILLIASNEVDILHQDLHAKLYKYYTLSEEDEALYEQGFHSFSRLIERILQEEDAASIAPRITAELSYESTRLLQSLNGLIFLVQDASSQEKDVLFGVTQNAFRILVLVGISISIFVIAVNYLLGAYVLRRFSLLSKTLRQIERNKNIDEFVDDAQDEISIVARQFNAVMSALTEVKDNLETKVNLRTKELENKLAEISDLNQSNEDTKRAIMNILEDQAETVELLEEEKVKKDAILESMSSGIMAVTSSGEISFVNKTAEKLIKKKEKELIHKNISGILDLEYFPEEKKTIEDLLLHPKAKNNTVKAFILVGRRNKKPAEFRIAPIKDVIGSPMGSIINIRDITLQYEQDRVKSEFISIASHQLRTPLSAIKWYTEMLLNGDAGKLKDQQKEFISNAYEAATRMNSLVNGLLNISRLESDRVGVHPKAFTLKDLIEDVFQETRPLNITRNHQLTYKNTSKVAEIVSDRALLYEVVLNLVVNAMKYTPAKGSIEVSVSKKDRKSIKLQVKDNGRGIPQSQQHRVFSKFFRGDNILTVDTEGTGLGLYVAKRTIELLGGEISFKSKEGSGTVFTIVLPIKRTLKKKGEKTLSKTKI